MLEFTGKTALCTGASAGIGREIARQLAREVEALVLVARRQDRLDELASELRRARGDLRVLVRAVDLVDRAATGAMLDALEREGVRVDVFINNAGSGDYGLFDRCDWAKTEQMLELNIVSASFLLRRLLPSMVERGFGAVLNVGSVAGMVANPGMAAYGATKAYFNLLTEGIRAELAGTGVHVTALCPGPVLTEFQGVAGNEGKNPLPQIFFVDAADCAAQGLEGLKRGEARVIPGPVSALMISLEALPKALVRPVLARMGRKAREEH